MVVFGVGGLVDYGRNWLSIELDGFTVLWCVFTAGLVLVYAGFNVPRVMGGGRGRGDDAETLTATAVISILMEDRSDKEILDKLRLPYWVKKIYLAIESVATY